ncbi:hypothetical protein HDV02_005024 [Globomyces sp. JEL0801]|nr:hypothetical protein HDV02_005024 [Globomyces sp. JEL0801]
MTADYIYPTQALCKQDAGIITEEQIKTWTENGYALVDGLVDVDLALKCRKEALEAVEGQLEDFGSLDGKLEFPTGFNACDAITLHPNLIRAAATLLKVPESDLRLMQSDIWSKTGKVLSSKIEGDNSWPPSGVSNDEIVKGASSNQNQRIHCDYGNNTLLHPPSWDSPECVSMIVYLSDETEVGGGTSLVSHRSNDDPDYQYPLIAMPGQAGIPFMNDREKCEEYMKVHHPDYYKFRAGLYAREKIAKFSTGTVLLYRHDVWHRGTPLIPGKTRVVCNLAYKRKECEWLTCWNQGFARMMYFGYVEKVVANATPLQRAILGIPMPGHSYWNSVTIAAVTARFGTYGFDPAPYYAALQ